MNRKIEKNGKIVPYLTYPKVDGGIIIRGYVQKHEYFVPIAIRESFSELQSDTILDTLGMFEAQVNEILDNFVFDSEIMDVDDIGIVTLKPKKQEKIKVVVKGGMVTCDDPRVEIINLDVIEPNDIRKND